MKEILKIESVSKSFSGLKVLFNVSLEICEGEISGLIGPNGAGKTTLFNAVSSSFMPSSGKVYFSGKDMIGKKTTDYALGELARTFQSVRVFSKMTVLENVAAGIRKNVHTDLLSICINSKKQKEAEKQASEKTMEILRFLKVGRFADGAAGNLPYGTQCLVEIARVLASKPRLLSLDEPTADMNQQETMKLMTLIQEIRKQGPAVLVIEHNMEFMMSLCHKIAVLNFDQLLTLSEPVAVQNDPQVIEVYLGNSEEEQHMALGVEGLAVKYGEIPTLKGISFTAEDGKLTALIDSNGAGRSTLLKTISGLLKPVAGSITLDGREIGGMGVDKTVTLDVSQCPEGGEIFRNQTVYEGLKMGVFTRRDSGVKADIGNHFNTFSKLGERHNQPAGPLSGEEQQMLAIYRALMARPKLLLLSEPSMRLAPIVVREMFSIIKGVNARGTSILLVEQSIKRALRTADYGYMLEIDNVTASDTTENLLTSKAIRGAYPGGV